MSYVDFLFLFWTGEIQQKCKCRTYHWSGVLNSVIRLLTVRYSHGVFYKNLYEFGQQLMLDLKVSCSTVFTQTDLILKL